MKKILLTICALFFVFASPLAAFEWGGLLTDNTGIQTPDFQNITLNQSNGISLWLNAPVGEDFSFAAAGSVFFSSSKSAFSNNRISYGHGSFVSFSKSGR